MPALMLSPTNFLGFSTKRSTLPLSSVTTTPYLDGSVTCGIGLGSSLHSLIRVKLRVTLNPRCWAVFQGPSPVPSDQITFQVSVSTQALHQLSLDAATR